MIDSTFKAHIPFITTNSLEKNYSNYIILDTREKKEFDISHLPNAIYVGDKKFNLKKTLKLLPKDKPIVVYCSIGARSDFIGKKIAKKEYSVYNLYGGIFKWLNERKKIVSSQNVATEKIHPYSKEWSQWLTNGTLTYE